MYDTAENNAKKNFAEVFTNSFHFIENNFGFKIMQKNRF